MKNLMQILQQPFSTSITSIVNQIQKVSLKSKSEHVSDVIKSYNKFSSKQKIKLQAQDPIDILNLSFSLVKLKHNIDQKSIADKYKDFLISKRQAKQQQSLLFLKHQRACDFGIAVEMDTRRQIKMRFAGSLIQAYKYLLGKQVFIFTQSFLWSKDLVIQGQFVCLVLIGIMIRGGAPNLQSIYKQEKKKQFQIFYEETKKKLPNYEKIKNIGLHIAERRDTIPYLWLLPVELQELQNLVQKGRTMISDSFIADGQIFFNFIFLFERGVQTTFNLAKGQISQKKSIGGGIVILDPLQAGTTLISLGGDLYEQWVEKLEPCKKLFRQNQLQRLL